jgi:hypothetical protein
MTNKMKFSTYAIKNTDNNKVYIGCTTEPNKRKTVHFSKLRNNDHVNTRLQYDFNKYGEESFKFVIINEFIGTPAYAKEIENRLINENNARGEGGYNKNEAQPIFQKDLVGDKNPMFGRSQSEDSRKKMSSTKKRLGTARGLKNSNARLSLDDYLVIIDMLNEDTGESYEQKYRRLSNIFNISTVTLKRIKLGKHHFNEYLKTRLKDRFKYIIIDFDGTIATLNYPNLGNVKNHAVRVIQRIKDNGGKIAIWTCRCDDDERKVKEFLDKHEIPYDKFNEPFDEMNIMFGGNPRKIYGDVYIDDKELHAQMNGGIDWLQIEEFLFEEVSI